MRIAFIGKQDLSKAALEVLLAHGNGIAALFCRPEKMGSKTKRPSQSCATSMPIWA
jgi:methionyl-tRNA formyltransferase